MRPAFPDRSARRTRLSLFGACLAFLLSAYAGGQAAPAIGRDESVVTTARRLVESWMAETGAPGAQVTVSRNGKIVWSEAFGFANLELQSKTTPKTRFPRPTTSSVSPTR